MAKNGNFFMEFWPTFDIFHRLRPYLCSKREVLGFYKQVTYMRPGDEPFFTFGSTSLGWGLPKNGPFLTKKNQAWQACSWLNQTKWKRFNGPYDIYIDGKTCVRARLLLGNSQKWQKMAQKCPFFDQKKPSMAGLLLTQPNQMETLWWAIWHLHR